MLFMEGSIFPLSLDNEDFRLSTKINYKFGMKKSHTQQFNNTVVSQRSGRDEDKIMP